MNLDEVKEIVDLQATGALETTNDHRISLRQALVNPEFIKVVSQTVNCGRWTEETLSVWLVGRENSSDGYMIVMRDDGLQFGLAANGFHSSSYPGLCGWYGGLLSAFLAM
jgi:hypothetical protein